VSITKRKALGKVQVSFHVYYYVSKRKTGFIYRVMHALFICQCACVCASLWNWWFPWTLLLMYCHLNSSQCLSFYIRMFSDANMALMRISDVLSVLGPFTVTF